MKKESIELLIPLMQCPVNKSNLKYDKDCIKSGTEQYKIKNNKIFILKTDTENTFKSERDTLDNLKAKLKYKLGGLYAYLTSIISPVLPRIYFPKLKTYWQHKCDTYATPDKVILQIGSGNHRINKEIINIDIFDFQEVDIIADCAKLPFKDSSIDGIISRAVLEHVSNPEEIIREAHRVIKPGGFIITGVPFIQGFHASPNDYFRWTHNGLTALHKNNGFDEEDIIPIAGPTSGMLWVIQEWLAILLSFNIKPLYHFFWILLTAITFPLKVLDILLIHYKFAHRIQSFYLYIGKKPL